MRPGQARSGLRLEAQPGTTQDEWREFEGAVDGASEQSNPCTIPNVAQSANPTLVAMPDELKAYPKAYPLL